MQCPKCQHENRAQAKFCEGCGTRLVKAAEYGTELQACGPSGKAQCAERDHELQVVAYCFSTVRCGRLIAAKRQGRYPADPGGRRPGEVGNAPC